MATYKVEINKIKVGFSSDCNFTPVSYLNAGYAWDSILDKLYYQETGGKGIPPKDGERV